MIMRIRPTDSGTFSHSGRFDDPDYGRSDDGMDELRSFLEAVLHHHLVAGHLRGLFHILIGRRIAKADGTLVSAGITWRELANLLKELRFDPDLAKAFDADPDEIAPRDRQRFWYSVIALARPDSAEAYADAEVLAVRLKPLGYHVAIATNVPTPTRPKSPPPPKRPESRMPKGKKK